MVRDLHSRGVPHLAVRVRDSIGLVGPLVIPGMILGLLVSGLNRVLTAKDIGVTHSSYVLLRTVWGQTAATAACTVPRRKSRSPPIGSTDM
jgi:hypothetical protein